MAEPRQYLVAHIQEALAADPRLHTLDVRVKVVGDTVLLTGSVETEGRRHAIEEIVHEQAGDLDVRNDVTVIGFEGTPGEEHLS